MIVVMVVLLLARVVVEEVVVVARLVVVWWCGGVVGGECVVSVVNHIGDAGLLLDDDLCVASNASTSDSWQT